MPRRDNKLRTKTKVLLRISRLITDTENGESSDKPGPPASKLSNQNTQSVTEFQSDEPPTQLPFSSSVETPKKPSTVKDNYTEEKYSTEHPLAPNALGSPSHKKK